MSYIKKLLLLLLIAISTSVFAESIVIINGLPLKKVLSSIEGTKSATISNDEQSSYRLLITKKDGKYLWASRENKELIFSQSGAMYNFVEPNGAGYIRVTKTEGKCLYMEHLTLALKNITYWGVTEECNLK